MFELAQIWLTYSANKNNQSTVLKYCIKTINLFEYIIGYTIRYTEWFLYCKKNDFAFPEFASQDELDITLPALHCACMASPSTARYSKCK